jgi:large subunit ribosomal protein L15
MKSRNRAIFTYLFIQIIVFFALLIWLWIRRYSQEGFVRTPRMEIDLTPGKPATVFPNEEPVQVQTPVVVEPAPKPVTKRRQAARADDLKRIEGIGPKIASTLQDAGITTYKHLARAKVERLKEILSEAGIPIADPTTWPEQAALAAAEDWAGLEGLQGTLKGGRRED